MVLPEIAPLAGATVFVTGGSGFVGRALIPYLLQHARVKQVRALTRSAEASQTVTRLGAVPVSGDLFDLAALREACTGVSHVFHLAAHVKQWGKYDEAYQNTVVGTQNVFTAARAAGVKRFIHCSTEAVLAGGKSRIINADEKQPIPEQSKSFIYSRTKALAEKYVVANNSEEMHTVVCRPRFIWGRGDTVLFPAFAKALKAGVFKWCNGGNYLNSTVHIENVCEGFVLAAQRGRPGGVYFLTDGASTPFREFVTRYLATQGLIAPPASASVPFWVLYSFAYVLEWGYWFLNLVGINKEPAVTRQACVLVLREVTIVDSLAREELGYTSHKSREEGFHELEQDYAHGIRLV